MVIFFFFWLPFFDKSVGPLQESPRNMDPLARQKLQDDQDLPWEVSKGTTLCLV